MTRATIYPGADTKSQWRGDQGTEMSSLNKVVLHTTESAGWPAYPTFQPTLTLDMVTGKVRQHLPVNRSASTLENSGTFKTNRANCVQIELVGYCDPARATSKYYLAHWTDVGYQALADFLSWLHAEWDVPLTSNVTWQPYPASYGKLAKQRLSVAAYSGYRGILGHQHVPGNEHGDPGRIDIIRLLSLTQKPTPAPAEGYPAPTSGEVYLSRLVSGQADSDSVYYAQDALRKLGLYSGASTGTYDTATAEAVKKWQSSPAAWAALFTAAGITVDIKEDQ